MAKAKKKLPRPAQGPAKAIGSAANGAASHGDRTAYERWNGQQVSRASEKPRRKDLPADANLCEHCTAKCCRYFALPIDTPDCRKDFDFIRWYLLHDRATVFIEDQDWYLLVHTVCRHLQDDYRCGIYDTRPEICREYTTKNCEYEDDWTYDKYFERPEQVAEYAEAVFPRKKRGSLRSQQPALLPVLV